MKNNRLLLFCLFILGMVFFSSCATTHPNSKLIIGRWKPESVEKYIDPNSAPTPATQSDNSGMQPGSNSAQPVKARPGDSARNAGKGGAQAGNAEQRMASALDRLIKMEQRAEFEVFPNGTAVKMYHPAPIKAKWKMKGKGKRVVVKKIDGDRKFVIDILELTETRCVLIEHTDAGDLKIVYTKL